MSTFENQRVVGISGNIADVTAANELKVSLTSITAVEDVNIAKVGGTPIGLTVPVSGSITVSNFPATQPVSGSVSVSNFPASQAVTGTFFQATQPVSLTSTTITNFPATQAISAAALPLPTGASTSLNQTNGTQQSQITDGTNVVSVKAASTAPVATDKALVVTISPNSPASPISGTVSVSNFPASQAVTGTFFQATQPISAVALPLPTGSSTSALQTTGNTSLASIDTKTPALGQALAASSVPVVLPAAQITTLTPPSNTGYALDTSVNTLLKPASTLAAVTNVGSVTSITNALPTGTNTLGSVKLTDGTNLATIKAASTAPVATDTAIVVSLSPNSTNISENIAQFGGSNVVTGVGASGTGIPRVTVANDSNILATQSGTWNITNVSGTVSLPTGASTSANQTNGTQQTKITDGTNIQAVKASTTAPVLADPASVVSLSPNFAVGATTPFKVTGGTVAVGDVGMAMYGVRNDTNGITGIVNGQYSRISVDDRGSVRVAAGQAPLNIIINDTANSVGIKGASTAPVATDPSLVVALSPNSTLPLPTGGSTSALQTTGNTSLSSIDTKTPALGQALAAASTPVVLTAAQITTLTPPTNIGYALDTSVNSLLKPTSTLAAVTTVTTVSAVTAITNALPTGTNTIGNTNLTLATAQFNKITDGTNTAAVKAASTAALATDPAIVVAISPNNTLPVSLAGNQATNLTQVAGVAIAQGHGVAATAIRVELPTDGTGVVGLNTGANIVGKVGIDQTTQGTTNFVTENLTQVGGTAIIVTGKVGSLPTQGAEVSGVAATANPVQTGGLAQTTLPAAVATTQVVKAMFDKFGRQVMVSGTIRDLVGRVSVTATTTASQTLLAAGGAGVFNDISSITISSLTALANQVNLLDGATIVWTGVIGATGGNAQTPMASQTFSPPLPQATANTAWNITMSNAQNTFVSIVYLKNQ